MKWFYKLEYKYGRYAIRNLMRYILVLYLAGTVLNIVDPTLYVNYLALDPWMIVEKFQIWRIFTFLMCAPDANNIFFALLSAYIYFSLGTFVERAWGAFRFNVFMFCGILYTIIGSFVVFALVKLDIMDPMSYIVNRIEVISVGTSYLNFSLFMAFAFTFPTTQMLFMFLIPIQAQILGWIEIGVYLVLFINGTIATRVMIAAAVLNVALFFLVTRGAPMISPKQMKRRVEFKRNVRVKPSDGPRHRCAICGKTERDDVTMEFRFCSKCAGDFEYCMEHLYTHKHVTPEMLEEMKMRAKIQMATGKPAVLESDIIDSEAREVEDDKSDGEA
ncbi:MAG: hypothetical protein IK125_01300 [Lachnospiraceae bacterium]|nr:hypothetical protein [Lachnospiraceae bacterium]